MSLFTYTLNSIRHDNYFNKAFTEHMEGISLSTNSPGLTQLSKNKTLHPSFLCEYTEHHRLPLLWFIARRYPKASCVIGGSFGRCWSWCVMLGWRGPQLGYGPYQSIGSHSLAERKGSCCCCCHSSRLAGCLLPSSFPCFAIERVLCHTTPLWSQLAMDWRTLQTVTQTASP